MSIQKIAAAGVLCVVAAVGLGSCGGDSRVSEQSRRQWMEWSFEFVSAVCSHDERCGRSTVGASCVESGLAEADEAVCDRAVERYLAHREQFDACIDPYPAQCTVEPMEACPELEDNGFGGLCD